MLRDHVARRTALGQVVQTHLDRGDLVPDQIVLDMLREAMAAAKAGEAGLSSTESRGTWSKPARPMSSAASSDDRRRGAAPAGRRRELTRRLLARAALEHRSDDTLEMIAQRLGLYYEVTSPILAWYRERGILVSVDAMRSAPEFGREILVALEAMRPSLDHVPPHDRLPLDLTSLGEAFGATGSASMTPE